MKGSVLELVIVFVILGCVMFGLLVGLKIYNQFTENDVWSDTDAGQSAKAGAEGAINAINYGMVFLMVGLIISMIFSAFFINAHPVFFVASLLMLIIVLVVAGPLSNAFMGMAGSDSLSSEADTLAVSTHIVGNLPVIAVVAGFLIMIALYAKPRGGGL